MKSILRFVVLAGLVVALGALRAAAQAPSGLVLNVPFTFSVEHEQLPAGEYRIQTMPGGRLLIRSTDGKAYTTVLTVPVRGKAPESDGKVVFNRYAGKYFLAQVWTPGMEIGRETFKSKSELELARQQRKQEIALLPKSPSGR